MTVQELYDFILTQMTAEQALMKLLEGSLIKYNKLKFPGGEEQAGIHPLIIIPNAAMDMEWQIAIEKDREEMEGITVGTAEYMDRPFNRNRKDETTASAPTDAEGKE